MAWVAKSIIQKSGIRQKRAISSGIALMLFAFSGVAASGQALYAGPQSVGASSVLSTTLSQSYSGLSGSREITDIMPRGVVLGQLNKQFSDAIDEAETVIKSQSLQSLIWKRVKVAMDLMTGKMKLDASALTPVVEDPQQASKHCKDKVRSPDLADDARSEDEALVAADNNEENDQEDERKTRKRSGFFAF